MPYDRRVHNRKSFRLKGYDYKKPGYYFVTTIVKGRACLLSEVINQSIHLLIPGEITQRAWLDLAIYYPGCQLDAACIMPDHFQGIIRLLDGNQIPLANMICAFKAYSARRINAHLKSTGAPFWQRNYYEHIIRNETALERIREYIRNNPVKWAAGSDNNAKGKRIRLK
jgi:putative transposase